MSINNKLACILFIISFKLISSDNINVLRLFHKINNIRSKKKR